MRKQLSVLAVASAVILLGAGCTNNITVKTTTSEETAAEQNPATPPQAEAPSEPAVKPYVKLIYPNGGEVFKPGQQVIIKWEFSGVSKVYLSLVNGGKEFGQIVDGGVDANLKEYTWTVPEAYAGMETGYKIFINNNDAANDIRDSSDETFSIKAQTAVAPATDGTENWETYFGSGYEFKYSQSAALVTGIKLQNKILNASGYWSAGGGITEVAVLNSQSTFSVGRNGNIATLAECKKVTWPNDQTEVLANVKVINGVTYYYGAYTGVAAGTSHKFNVYHTFDSTGKNGCFELVVSVSPLSGSAKVSEQILATFKFTR